MTQARRGFDRAQAAAWVQAEMDFLRLRGYGLPTPLRTIPDDGYLTEGNLVEPRLPGVFAKAQIEVAEVPGLPLNRLTVRLCQTSCAQPYTILVTYISNFSYP
jgi:hypothetical protein